ncbi:PIN domain-containing protein [Aquibium carbonis]|uniref:Ribonuclease VapC n=1 Tax=Aquibium carbonis TaxID=2495581 RepID=A0A429YY14_9HYPH|nr:TA system VapC family ribonuclease toxin [Aquibium carbonis]RST86313.1 PIN domain-containing protein [Aquibium carbonis]
MRSLLDVNVLLALFDPIHVHHERAHRWWSSDAGDGWATCPITQNGFLRVVSNPNYPSPIPLSDAQTLLSRQIGAASHEFWQDTISLTDAGRFDFNAIRGPKQLTDVYLLALALSNAGRLITFDTRITSAPVIGATARNLLILT